MSQPTCAKCIDVCCDEKCVHKDVFQEQYYLEIEWSNKWKGNESTIIPSLCCDHNKHFATWTPIKDMKGTEERFLQ